MNKYAPFKSLYETEKCDLVGVSAPVAMVNKSSFQVKFVQTSESSDPKFRKDFPNYVTGTIRSEPGNYVTCPPYAQAAEKIYKMTLRPDDVFVISFPKCGKSTLNFLFKINLIKKNDDFKVML